MPKPVHPAARPAATQLRLVRTSVGVCVFVLAALLLTTGACATSALARPQAHATIDKAAWRL